MEKFQFELLKAVFSNLLQLILRVDIPRIDLLKAVHKLSAGFEARDGQGEVLNLAHIGCHFTWLIEAATKKRPPFLIVPGLENPIKYFHFTGDNLHHLAELAKRDLAAWQALQELLDELNSRNALPEQFTPSDMIQFTHNKPSGRRGQNALLNRHRNALVVMLIEGAERSGLGPISRSCTSNTLSVCDALKEASSVHGAHLTYDAIKTIWDRRRSLLKENIGAFRIDIPANDSPNKEIFIGFSRPTI